MRAIFLGVAAAVWLGNVACSTGRSQQSPASVSQDRIAVSVTKPERRTIKDRLELAGSITPYEQVTVYAKTSGYLKWIKVDSEIGFKRGTCWRKSISPKWSLLSTKSGLRF
jgi:multidrug efflux pump subunit AcrA (membrane-fusion protein)